MKDMTIMRLNRISFLADIQVAHGCGASLEETLGSIEEFIKLIREDENDQRKDIG
jgi:hypothetical protein